MQPVNETPAEALTRVTRRAREQQESMRRLRSAVAATQPDGNAHNNNGTEQPDRRP